MWDHTTHPPKPKRHICVCPEKQLFFRINSDPTFPPHLPIRADNADFLEHDSYIELMQLVRLQGYHIQQAERLGTLTMTHKRAIVISLEQGGWMAEDWIEFVRDRFDL